MIDPLQIFISFVLGAWFASYVIAKHNDKFMEIIEEYNRKLGVKKSKDDYLPPDDSDVKE